MPVHMVESYVMRSDMNQNRPWLIVNYKDGTQSKNVNWFPPKEDAQYLGDMLRNEKSIYYVESISGAKWLTTSAEEIAKEES